MTNHWSLFLTEQICFARQASRQGVNMIAFSQINHAAQQQVKKNARGLLLDQTQVIGRKMPEAEWIAAQPPDFVPRVLVALSRPATVLLPKSYRYVRLFLEHVQADKASKHKYQFKAVPVFSANRALPSRERVARLYGRWRAYATRVWADLGRPRPEPTSWAKKVFVEGAEAYPKPDQWFSTKPGMMLTALLAQRLPSRFTQSHRGQIALIIFGSAVGVLIGCVCFVLSIDPLLHVCFAQRKPSVIAEGGFSRSKQVLDRVWPTLPNPYEEQNPTRPRTRAQQAWETLLFEGDKKYAIVSAVDSHRWQTQIVPLRQPFNPEANRAPTYPLLDDAFVIELDELQVVDEFNNQVRPNYPADRLVRALARLARSTHEPSFFSDIIAALTATHQRNDRFLTPMTATS